MMPPAVHDACHDHGKATHADAGANVAVPWKHLTITALVYGREKEGGGEVLISYSIYPKLLFHNGSGIWEGGRKGGEKVLILYSICTYVHISCVCVCIH
jgi:hypothetical protein